jgi:YqaJ-like viral recombinase domain
VSLSFKPADRQGFIGGSDARVIMGNDEAALLRLWREKRGEVEPEDLSANLIVQLGVVTEPLNRHWFERNTDRSYLRLRDFRKRTPSPPPFSAMNSMPAASIARCSFARASSETRGPNPPSSRLTVGRDSPARSASSD